MTVPPPAPAFVARFRAGLEALAGAAPGRLGIAVSGGPDSLALLLLASAAFPGEVAAATVDHRLRPESAGEAGFVAELCARLGLPHIVLTADIAVAGNLQSAARALRYRLLARWAAEAGIALLLTGHHADDQAETLLMRLDRGAGLSGLAAIRAATGIAGLAVARPLLGWRRAELAAIVAAAGLVPVADPSNDDDRFDRARLRKRLAAAGWIDPVPLARSAAALAEADAALDWAAGRLAEERIAPFPAASLSTPPAFRPSSAADCCFTSSPRSSRAKRRAARPSSACSPLSIRAKPPPSPESNAAAARSGASPPSRRGGRRKAPGLAPLRPDQRLVERREEARAVGLGERRRPALDTVRAGAQIGHDRPGRDRGADRGVGEGPAVRRDHRRRARLEAAVGEQDVAGHHHRPRPGRARRSSRRPRRTRPTPSPARSADGPAPGCAGLLTILTGTPCRQATL